MRFWSFQRTSDVNWDSFQGGNGRHGYFVLLYDMEFSIVNVALQLLVTRLIFSGMNDTIPGMSQTPQVARGVSNIILNPLDTFIFCRVIYDNVTPQIHMARGIILCDLAQG